MTEALIGEIRMFGFAETPVGWIPCDGSELPTNLYTPLWQVIGYAFGGKDDTFKVPDFRGRAPIHTGSGPNLTPRSRGEVGGFDAVVMDTSLPPHGHAFTVATATATQHAPGPEVVIGALSGDTTFLDNSATGAQAVTWANEAIEVTGEGAPHENCMPTLTLNFCIRAVLPSA